MNARQATRSLVRAAKSVGRTPTFSHGFSANPTEGKWDTDDLMSQTSQKTASPSTEGRWDLQSYSTHMHDFAPTVGSNSRSARSVFE